MAELGLTLVPSYVAEPGEITRQVPESVDVGTWPSWFAEADIASYETVEAALEKVVRGIDPDDPFATPTCTGSTGSASATSCARNGATPGRAARLRAGAPEPVRRLDRAQSMFAYARKQAVGGGTAAYDVEEWENQRVAEGSATVALTDGGAGCPTYASPRRSRAIAIARTAARHTSAGERSPATRSCSPCRPVPRATSRSPGSATRG